MLIAAPEIKGFTIALTNGCIGAVEVFLFGDESWTPPLDRYRNWHFDV